MYEDTKKQYVAEAKCLIASSYFNLFRMYGGLPLVTHSYDVNGDKLDAPRASVEKTLNFILKLYDEAINSGALPFAYSDDDVTTMKAHWTKAAAMAMKCRVLQFAASPSGGSRHAPSPRYSPCQNHRWNYCWLLSCNHYTPDYT